MLTHVLFFIHIYLFFTLYTVAHLVNTTLHSYVNKCTIVLENKIYISPKMLMSIEHRQVQQK